MKVLFITPHDFLNADFGGAVGTKRNYDCIGNFTEKLDYIIVGNTQPPRIKHFLNRLFSPNKIFVTLEDFKEIKRRAKNGDYDIIFLDSSLLGRIIKKLKRYSAAKIVTFFHNAEIEYFKRAIEVKNASAITMLKQRINKRIYKKNERLAIKNSDRLIILSKRDLEDLKINYKKQASRITDERCYVFPITLKDDLIDSDIAKMRGHTPDARRSGLFFGFASEVNISGVRWFLDNVTAHTNVNYIIAGKGFDKYKEEFSRENVTVYGKIDDVKELYLQADFIFSPILTGSGMKLKTCEALMYGKTIFGTTEAFSGYDLDPENVGGLCNTAEEFIEEINRFDGGKFNEYSRVVYLEKYSNETAQKRLYEISSGVLK